MRLEADGTIVLSRRNLLALLTKLEMPGSARTIYFVQDGKTVFVRAEDDITHYSGREFPPGHMHPETEAAISAAGNPLPSNGPGRDAMRPTIAASDAPPSPESARWGLE